MAVTSSQNHQYFSPKEMMAEAEKFALSKANKTSSMTLSLAIMAGAFIGLAFLFYITVTTGSAGAGWGLSRLAGGLAFSMGLILIVICGGELFTSSVLSSISWANKQISFGKMLSIWGKVYVGNFIGAMFLLALVTAAGLYQMDSGQWGLNALNIAQHKLHHTLIQAFALGILCNLLVCLAIWLTFSSANAMTKAAMTIMPVAMFVSSGFEHRDRVTLRVEAHHQHRQGRQEEHRSQPHQPPYRIVPQSLPAAEERAAEHESAEQEEEIHRQHPLAVVQAPAAEVAARRLRARLKRLLPVEAGAAVAERSEVVGRVLLVVVVTGRDVDHLSRR